jgi:formamidopyrimidine-DNA glycosylase
MPELPEVETIVRYLREGKETQPSVLNKTVSSAVLLWERTFANGHRSAFSSTLEGKTIRGISRRGKFILFDFSELTMLVHLRMSGDLWVERLDQPIAQHLRLYLELSDGWRLGFYDPRKFGRAWLVSDPQEILSNLGPEPLDTSYSEENFYDSIMQYHRQLKSLLLDQGFLAGLGNIYTDEALHLAKLHPLRKADTLTSNESSQLLQSIRTVLREAIRRQGASIDWVYRGGEFQNYFRVYQRDGQACPVCGTLIQRIVLGQRGTHFCPLCQPEPGE